MLNRNVEVIPLVQIDILKGRSFADLKTLKEIILNEYNNNNRLSHVSYGSRYEDTHCPPHPIVDEIINEMIIDFKAAANEDLECSGYWAHIHEKNMSTNTHDHQFEFASAALYLSVPKGSGDLVFLPKVNPYDKGEYRSVFPPEEGCYYLFPGFMDHFVTRNNSEEKRISLSFNFRKLGTLNHLGNRLPANHVKK